MEPIENDPLRIYPSLIRMIRMLLVYVFPSYLFVRRYGGSLRDMGIRFPEKYAFISLIGGMMIYVVVGFIFLKYQIFFGGWRHRSWNTLWIIFMFVGIMASVTDFWTRGFILLEIERKEGEKAAIFYQNLTWFVIHIYEIDLLIPYIGLVGAIIMTLFLGIVGDIIALRTKSIIGLMLGHIALNLMVILAAKEVINVF